MRIRDFFTTLNFAIINSDNSSRDVFRDFKNNFDENMEIAAEYIEKLYRMQTQDGPIDEESFKLCLIEDYDKMLDETYRSTYIYSLSMKYIALKYLEKHRSEIPALKKEIEERGLVYEEDESFTDNFHENLLRALLSAENDYRVYYENMAQINGEYLVEINDFWHKYGKEEGFKKYCEKYSKIKSVQMSVRRHFLSYAYLIMFGLEGSDNLAISKYKKSYAIKEYITTFSERMEKDYREELVASVISLTSQLDRFGLLAEYRDEHARKMSTIGLPGLRYTVSTKELRATGELKKVPENVIEKSNNPSVSTLLSEDELKKLPIDVLLRMNSFYNNRVAKRIHTYAISLFVYEEANFTMNVIQGERITRKDIDSNFLENLLLKFEVIRLPVKNFFEESQRDVEEHCEKYNKKEIEYADGTTRKQAVIMSMESFVKDVKNSWRKEYQEYFDERLPECNNDLRQDILFINKLYNPIFLSYRLKNLAMKSEYAYMYYLSQVHPEMSLNFGIVIPRNQNALDVVQSNKSIFVASDGILNFPNRLHTIRTDYIDFIKAYTGSPLIRLYEGIEDFDFFRGYTTAQLLLPITAAQVKYLKELKKGKRPKDDSNSKVHSGNEALVDHILFCADRKSFMPRHCVPVTRYDKKGNPVISYLPRVRYVDSRDGEIYTINEYGKLVGKNGKIIEMNGEVIKSIKSYDE